MDFLIFMNFFIFLNFLLFLCMLIFDVFGQTSLLCESLSTILTGKQFLFMNNLYMSLQMMLIPKFHNTVQTLELLLMSMRDHMPLQMRTPFEFTITILVSTNKFTHLFMFFSDMSENVGSFCEDLTAMFADQVWRGVGDVEEIEDCISMIFLLILWLLIWWIRTFLLKDTHFVLRLSHWWFGDCRWIIFLQL